MTHPTDQAASRHAVATKPRVYRTETAWGHVWRVDLPCGCLPYYFRTWHVALIFALHHRCPAAWAPIPQAVPLVRGGVR